MITLEEKTEEMRIQQLQSSDFQVQIRNVSEAMDLEKGVFKMLDMVRFDRKTELSRITKKVDDFRKRLQMDIKMDGDEAELKDMYTAAEDLEKKVTKGLTEVARLKAKTEFVVARHQEKELREVTFA